MILILKVISMTTAMICSMLMGFAVICKLSQTYNIDNNLMGFVTISYMALCLYLPKIIIKTGEKDDKS